MFHVSLQLTAGLADCAEYPTEVCAILKAKTFLGYTARQIVTGLCQQRSVVHFSIAVLHDAVYAWHI